MVWAYTTAPDIDNSTSKNEANLDFATGFDNFQKLYVNVMGITIAAIVLPVVK